MSSTAVMTMAVQPPAMTTTLRSDGAGSCCPGCGLGLSPTADRAQTELLVARARIQELEAQVQQLSQKAAASVGRWAEYEAELATLRASPPKQSPQNSTPSRLSSFLHPRRAASTPPAAAATSTTPPDDLREALVREQTLRREAEGRLSATSREVEELSASLFEQANEMVADERRARARLEERVGELEKRDTDKRRRLERLEVAVERIDRVRSLLEDK